MPAGRKDPGAGPARETRPPDAPPEQAPPEPGPPEQAPPPYFEATEPLYVHNPESGTLPARAFSPGDRVPPELVEPNGWAGKVRVPAVFAPPEPESPPRSAPAAVPPGQPAAKE